MDLDQSEEAPQPQGTINGSGEFGALVQDYLDYSQSYQDEQDDTAITDQVQVQEQPNATAISSWEHTQSYMVVEYDIESLASLSSTISNKSSAPIMLSSTRDSYSTTVGQSRKRLGLKNDHVKSTNQRENNYFKSLKWSPDGSCLLSASNDNYLRIFALPDTAGCGHVDSSIEHSLLEAGLAVGEGEAIHDMSWYPRMTTQDPASCCFLSSSRDHPVHLWDAYTGKLRCSYTIVDHCEVNLAPNSLCFNLDGSKIYCGLNNMIEIFDTTRPGRDSIKRPTTPTRRSKQGQKGVISCLTFNPDGSGLYAAGSYSKSIGFYDNKTDKLVLLLKDRDQYGRKKSKAVLAKMHSTSTQLGGITQLQFSPDGHYLYSASRQDPWIRCWDIRNTTEVLFRLRRPGPTTNQRVAFDISPDGRYLTTGDTLGGVTFFDLSEPERERSGRSSAKEGEVVGASEAIPTRERYSFQSHEDIVSSATFNPVYPILATCSGQRKYQLQHSSFSDSESSGDSDSDSESESKKIGHGKLTDGHDTAGIVNRRDVKMMDTEEQVDNSIRTWSLPGKQVWYVNGQRWEASSEHEGNKSIATEEDCPLDVQ